MNTARTRLSPLRLLACAALACTASGASADSIVLQPVADATLIESVNAQEYALGAALQIYCGRVGVNGSGTLRRAVLRFNLAAIPAGSTITSASLKVYMSQTSSGTQTTTLRRLLENWGEGASFAFGGAGTAPEANDATWVHSFYPGVSWSVPGGNFSTTISASKAISGAGAYVFASTPALIADVQGWLAAPATNFGWIMIGNEAVLETAKRFESRESGDPTRRPLLTIVYTPPALVGDLNADAKVNGADLGLLLAGWGYGGASDLDASGVTDGADLAVLLANWHP